MLRKMLVALVLAVAAAIPALADDRADCAEAHVKESAPRAIVACTALIEQHGADAARLAWAYNQRGLAYFTTVEWKWAAWARRDYRRALTLKGDFAEAYFNRAVKSGLAFPDREATLRDLSTAIRLNRNYAEAYAARGSILAASKKIKDAMEDYSTALRLKPDADTFTLRARAYEALGQKEGADADHVAALKAAPSALEALTQGWSAEAVIRRLSQYLEADPKSGQAYLLRARARRAKGEGPDAVAADYLKARDLEWSLIYKIAGDNALPALDQVIEREPQWPIGYHVRAWVRWEAGEREKALADFERALALDTGYAQAYFDRGRKRAKVDGAGAIADFRKAFELLPELLKGENWKAFAWGASVGADDDAWTMALASAVIEVVPGHAPAHVRRGLARTAAGDIEGALRDYERSKELEPGDDVGDRARLAIPALSALLEKNPKDADRLFARARAHAELGAKDAAIDDATATIAIRPGWSDAYLLRSRQHRLKDEVERAIADLKEAVAHKAKGEALPGEDLSWLGQRLVERKVWEEALAVLMAALPSSGLGGGELHFALGDAYQGKGRPPVKASAIGFSGEYTGSARHREDRWSEKAIAEWRKGLALDPALWNSRHLDVAWKLRNSGDAAAALEEFTRAVVLAPDFAPAYAERAEQLVVMGRYDEAFADYAEALRLKEEDGAAKLADRLREYRVGAYFRGGQDAAGKGAHEEAASSFSKALEDVSGYAALHVYAARAKAHLRAGSYFSGGVDYVRYAYFGVVQNPDVAVRVLGIFVVVGFGISALWAPIEGMLGYLWRWAAPHLPEGPAIWRRYKQAKYREILDRFRLHNQERHQEILDRFGTLKWATERQLAYVIGGAERAEREATLVVRAGQAGLRTSGEWIPDVESAYDRKLALAIAMTATVFGDDGLMLTGEDRNFNLLQYAAQTVVGTKAVKFTIESASEQAVVDEAVEKMRGELAALNGGAVGAVR